MRLIGLAVVLTVSLTLVPLAAEAQQAKKAPRIGILSPPERLTSIDVFQRELRDLG